MDFNSFAFNNIVIILIVCGMVLWLKKYMEQFLWNIIRGYEALLFVVSMTILISAVKLEAGIVTCISSRISVYYLE